MRTVKFWLVMVGMVGILATPFRAAEAATIDEVINQVNTYTTSGEINDAGLADALLHILWDAKHYEGLGDTVSKNNYLEAFKVAVSNSGDLMTAAAASTLVGMAQ